MLLRFATLAVQQIAGPLAVWRALLFVADVAEWLTREERG